MAIAVSKDRQIRNFFAYVTVLTFLAFFPTGHLTSSEVDADLIKFAYVKAENLTDLKDFVGGKTPLWRTKEFEEIAFSEDSLTQAMLSGTKAGLSTKTKEKIHIGRFLILQNVSGVKIRAVAVLDEEGHVVTEIASWKPNAGLILCTRLTLFKENESTPPVQRETRPSIVAMMLEDGEEYKFAIDLENAELTSVGSRDRIIRYGYPPLSN